MVFPLTNLLRAICIFISVLRALGESDNEKRRCGQRVKGGTRTGVWARTKKLALADKTGMARKLPVIAAGIRRLAADCAWFPRRGWA